MLPASAGATAAKVLVCFFVLCYLLNSLLDWGARKKSPCVFFVLCYLLNSPLGGREKNGLRLGSDFVATGRQLPTVELCLSSHDGDTELIEKKRVLLHECV
jgi:hypothetical protein